ncbi:helix-turn-helix transcriptional regulator [Streptomyces sp. NBC_00448]|uniref:helix-turn-helix transcriptional regulator n=1 Tax=Streptomyces sp. NBC_00448 TaxID=2903652 RepID=UPI002E20240D
MDIEIIESTLADFLSGQARLLFIEGASGCGKSDLIDFLAKRAVAEGAALLHGVGSPGEADVPSGVLRQLLADAPTPRLAQVPQATDGRPRAEAMREFCAAIQELSQKVPVVCCVDDLQYADAVSLQYLQALIRHARTGPVLLVAARSLHFSSQDPTFDTELLRRPDFRRIRLGRLSEAAVAEAVAGYPRIAAIPGSAAALHHISGGNPLLLRALLEETRATAPPATTTEELEPERGGLFSQAVLTCVLRSGPAAFDLGVALALLQDRGSPEQAALLLGIPVSAVEQADTALRAAGILDGHRFRHPGAAAAVLDALEPAKRARLHRRCARLAYQAQEPAAKVIQHLRASVHAHEPWPDTLWAVDVLRERAEQLMVTDDPRQAADLLHLAYDACTDEGTRAEIKTRLSSITWRFDPAAAEKHLTEPLRLARAGQLSKGRLTALVRSLSAQGRIAETDEVLRRMNPPGPESDTAHDPYPNLPHAAFWAVRDRGMSDLADCERFLQDAVLTETTLLPIVQALQTLILSEHPERATPWCQTFADDAACRNAPAWTAVFATLHGDVLLRLGDLRGAERQALRAWEALPGRNGTVFVAAPAALLIRARTAMGQHATVARLLDLPIANSRDDSVYLSSYLYARGVHYVATNQYASALRDFLEVGRLLRSWGLDRPVALPWRTEAADALVRLGEPEQAEQLVAEQLSLPDARHPRVRGISLRLRAAIRPPEQRQALLKEAIDELRLSGDRVELARALADLGQHLQAVGETNRASMLTRRAWNLAHACGAKTLREVILPGLAAQLNPCYPTVPRQRRGAEESDAKLSESERRVAALAAHGYTNREISSKLYITVSTVEQHLTHVYRKLSISRRQDLPVDLPLGSMESA